MLILNFSHPLTDDQKNQRNAHQLTGQAHHIPGAGRPHPCGAAIVAGCS